MPVPFPVSKVGSDKQKVEFLTIFGRPKTRFFDQISAEFRNFPKFPLATNHAVKSRSRIQGRIILLDVIEHRHAPWAFIGHWQLEGGLPYGTGTLMMGLWLSISAGTTAGEKVSGGICQEAPRGGSPQGIPPGDPPGGSPGGILPGGPPGRCPQKLFRLPWCRRILIATGPSLMSRSHMVDLPQAASDR